MVSEWFLSEHILQAKGGLFWFGNLRASYSIATPAKVSSGSRPRPGMGAAMRRRTICIASPQHGQRKAGRGLSQACSGLGAILSTSCSSEVIGVRLQLNYMPDQSKPS